MYKRQADRYAELQRRVQALKQDEEGEMSQESIDYEKLANTRAELLKVEQEADQLRPAATEAPVTEEDLAKVCLLYTSRCV